MLSWVLSHYFNSMNSDVLCKLDNRSDPLDVILKNLPSFTIISYHFSIIEPLKIYLGILEVEVGFIRDFCLLSTIFAYEKYASDDIKSATLHGLTPNDDDNRLHLRD